MATCPDCGAHYRDDVRECDVDGATLLPDGAVANLDDDLEPGDEVGEYTIDEKIGSGSFGAVYSATHMLIGKRAAIKVLASRHSTDRKTVARFLSEARAVNQIRHKHIVDIFSFGSLDDGRQYFVMELLEGKTLKEHLSESGSLPPAEAIAILRRIARALDAAHKADIAHRDLKPDNVFLTFDEDGVFPKLLDFGVAKLLDDDKNMHTTGTGTPMGTPLYMSPEQWRGKNVDHRSDIFSLGVMAFELLAGTRPYHGESPMDLMVKVATEEAPRLSSLLKDAPEGVDEALAGMLAHDPDDRPQSASAAIASLAAAYREAGADMLATYEPINTSRPPRPTESMPPPSSADSARAPRPISSEPHVGVSQTLEEAPPSKRPRWLPIALAAVAIGAVVLFLSLRDDGAATPVGDPPGLSESEGSPATQARDEGTGEDVETDAAEVASAEAQPEPTASAAPPTTAASAEPAAPSPKPTPVAVPKPVPAKPAPGPKDRPIIPVLER